MSNVNPLTVIFLGTQGSGKGTQLELVKQRIEEKDKSHKVVTVGMGKLLREVQEWNNYTGRRTREILAGGNLIPYAISSARLSNYLMENIETGEEHLLIDGFPRTPEQVPTIDSVMEFFRREQPTIVYMQISDEEAVRRIMPRGRHDDTEEGIRQRLKWSKELTIPNIEWFRKNPKYKVIDVFGERPIEVVQQEIREKLGLL